MQVDPERIRKYKEKVEKRRQLAQGNALYQMEYELRELQAKSPKTAGIQITDTDILERFALQARKVVHRGKLCERPVPVMNMNWRIGVGLRLIVSDGDLFIIDEAEFRREEEEEEGGDN